MLKSLVREIVSLSALQPTSTAPTPELLQTTWSTLVGEELARCTLPVGLHNEILELEISSARWLDEFSRHRMQLLTRIAKLLPWPVSDLRLALVSPANAQKFASVPAPRPEQQDGSAPDSSGSSLSQLDSQQLAAEMNLSPSIQADLDAIDEDLRLKLLRIRQHIHARKNNDAR